MYREECGRNAVSADVDDIHPHVALVERDDVQGVPSEFFARFVVPRELGARGVWQIVGEEGLLNSRSCFEFPFHPLVGFGDPLVGAFEEAVLVVQIPLELEDPLAGPDARPQLVFVEGLGDEIVGSRFDALHDIAFLRARREQDRV